MERRGDRPTYQQSDAVPLMVEQVGTWVGVPTIFAPGVCLKARPARSRTHSEFFTLESPAIAAHPLRESPASPLAALRVTAALDGSAFSKSPSGFEGFFEGITALSPQQQ